MRFSNAHNLNGFTQIEISITLIIIGILSALAAPSLLGWYGTKQVEEALEEFRGVLKEAQSNAIRISNTCTLNITTSSPASITSTPTTCLPRDRIFDGISIRISSGLTNLQYDYLGETNLSSTETVVFSNPNNGGVQKCLVIAGPIGLTRIGTYLASDTTGTNSNNCNSQQ